MLAYNRRAQGSWRAMRPPAHVRRYAGSSGPGLTGAELERALMAMAITNPDIVAVRHG